MSVSYNPNPITQGFRYVDFDQDIDAARRKLFADMTLRDAQNILSFISGYSPKAFLEGIDHLEWLREVRAWNQRQKETQVNA